MGPRFENRGKGEGVQVVIDEQFASMGPRFENRGKDFRHNDWRKYRQCFNGATVRKPWKVQNRLCKVYDAALLQWGHGSKTVERGTRDSKLGGT